MLNIKHSTDYVGLRLDAYIASVVPSLSRSSVQKLIDMQKVFVNGLPGKTSYKLRDGDNVSIDHNPDSFVIPEIKLPILYEDDDCMVINKPVGVLSHSKGAFNPEATVATFMSTRVNDLTGDRAGIVHRLDRATSGVMICAKNPDALSWLQKQFSQRKAYKTYVAVVEGRLKPESAIIDIPIERNPKNPKTFRAGTHGKPAQTQYDTIKTNSLYSMLELHPQTGRTHQIRVHLKQLGHPIVGDSLYGGVEASRVMLHAKSLEITLPNRKREVFTAKLPNEFNRLFSIKK